MNEPHGKVPPGPPAGPEGSRLYTMRETVILGRRALCETSEDGHEIGVHLLARNARGELVVERYGCANCDVIVSLRYPSFEELESDTRR